MQPRLFNEHGRAYRLLLKRSFFFSVVLSLALLFTSVCYLLFHIQSPGHAHAAAPANTAVVTFKNDISQSGQNPYETTLTTSNVNSASFGKRVSYPVDGQVYAQPLFVPNVSINGSIHNVVYVVTEHDSVYAFDADHAGSASAPLWQTSFLTSSSITSVPSDDISTSCKDLIPEVGITGTPTIDLATGTLYLVAMTKENGVLTYRLHALDITTGSDKPGSSIVISASVQGTGDGHVGSTVTFDPLHERQRGNLLLANGQIYISWASFCDNGPYHGWIMSYSYDGSAFQQKAVYNNTPNAGGGGIWSSGGTLSADSNGSIYYISGNGRFDLNTPGGQDASDSFVRLNALLQVQDYFTPFNQACLTQKDADLGSGGPLLIPGQNRLISAGKEGRIYVLDTTNMGQYNAIDNPCGSVSRTDVDRVVQEFPPQTTGGIFSTPAYWNGSNGQYVYFTGVGDPIKAYSFSNGKLSSTPVSQTPQTFGFTSGNSAVSSNGTIAGTGILWLVDPNAKLRAYDATNLGNALYDSGQNPARDRLDSYVKFSVATVANGRVFVGTKTTLSIFGLLNDSPPVSPTPSPSPSTTVSPTPSPSSTVTPTPTSGSGSLTANLGTPAGTLNLTGEGSADWTHWGTSASWSFDHKESTVQQISKYSHLGNGPVSSYTDSTIAYSWNDGIPSSNVSNSKSGISVTGPGNGFKFSVPADTTPRTLKVYLGVSSAQGMFSAALSDNSAPIYHDTSLSSVKDSAKTNGVYTITYAAASANQRLVITFTINNTFNGGGTLGLESATLSGGSRPSGYNNIGITADSNTAPGDFDGWGHSYSRQALQAQGINAGDNVFAGGMVFTWPDALAGAPSNYVSSGQTLPISASPNATTLGFLGAASNGPSDGSATLTYSDGTTQSFTLSFCDWTLNGGQTASSCSNTRAITMPYYNNSNGRASYSAYVFYLSVSLQAGKTPQSVTLPSNVGHGQLHVFAIATK